jgi:CheY-like chemotaxis protein
MSEQVTDTARDFRVLIVDDNRDAANSLATLARFWGYDVRTAYDGAAGLEAAGTFRPDCLVLDIGLPRLDGYRLARHVREHPALSRAKLVALTAYSSDEHRRRAQEAGFDYYLIKPADPDTMEDLLKMLEHALELVKRTEALAEQNVALARETKHLLTDVKVEINEVKDELKEVKHELKEVKEELGKEPRGHAPR